MDLLRRAGFQNFTEVQDGNFRRHVEHHVHVMLDQQDGEMRIELHQELRHLGGLARRQAGGRFVEQQDFRIAGESEHDLELALLAMRQVAHLGVLAVEEARLLEQLMGLVVHVPIRGHEPPHDELRRAQTLDTEDHVVEHGQLRKQAGDLEGARHAERGAAVARPIGDVLAEQQHFAGGHGKDAGDEVEQRGLARAVGADDRFAVTRHHAQADVARGLQAAEALRQGSELEDGYVAAVRLSLHAHYAKSRMETEGSGPPAWRGPEVSSPICNTCTAGSRGYTPAASGTLPA